jgi:hypothetical protein
MITLATLHEYTAQEVFDYISNHLLSQAEKCEGFDDDMNPVCVYRNTSNQCCAAGCLISPEEYGESIEGKDWNTLMNNGKVPVIHHGLISSMQKVHDTHKADDWYKALKEVARIYDFKTSKLDQCAKVNHYL